MGLKELIEKRNDILFAEIGALIHDLGKLSKEFVKQMTLHSHYVPYEHHLIIGRDFKYINSELNKANLTNQELNNVLQQLKKIDKKNFSINEFEKILKRIQKTNNYLNSLPSKSQKSKFINRFLSFLKSVYSSQKFNSQMDWAEQIRFKVKNRNDYVELSLADIISVHHSGREYEIEFYCKIKNLNRTLEAIKFFSEIADKMDSSIDKVAIDEQSYDKFSLSSAFGKEYAISPEKIDMFSNKLCEKIEKELTKESINREKTFNHIRNIFLQSLGETRRPANDVTLWDHSFSVASLYKAALAEVVINEWKEPQNIKWKLLSTRFNGDEFYYTVPKIADVLGRKALVENILDKIKFLLEVLIPIGNEIYRDENGSVFLVPMSAKDENGVFKLDDVWENIKDIKFKNVAINFKGEWESKKLEDIANNSPNLKELIKNISSFMSAGIFIPEIELSDSSRGALNLGGEISKERKYNTDIEKLKQKWVGKKEGYERCTVCSLKPVPFTYKEKENLDKKIKNEGWQKLSEEERNQYKAYERKICVDCLKFAYNRVYDWYNNKKWNREHPEKPSFDTSVWLDEIADENNRIALVYLSFDLEKWLTGEMLNTFLSKPLLDETVKNSFEFKRNAGLKEKLNKITTYNQLIDLIKKAFNSDNFEEELSLFEESEDKIKVKELFSDILGCYIKEEQNTQELFDSLITSREPKWKDKYPSPPCTTKGDNEHKAVVFLLHLTRKHPSFARLKRIWETTRNFGIDIFEKTKNELEKKKRKIITFKLNDNLKITHTYWFKDKNGKKCELVVIKNKNEAAMISNSEAIEIPDNERLELYNENFKTRLTTIIEVKNKNTEIYYPLIPYQFEPSKTLFFMPLKQVWEIIQLIKKEYEVQFNKVQNRLPINIGFIAFHKRTPMYAVLDAAKKMYSRKIEKEKFEICSIHEIDAQKNCRLYEGKIGGKVKGIKLKNGYEYHFSYSTGDPGKEDLFHPYFIVENSNGWKTCVEGDWKTIKHVKDLQEGHKVSFYPSCFDFLWLDTNTRRLDVGKNRIHWLFKENSPKPYNLKDIETFERLRKLLLEELKLTASQLLNVYGLLISKLQEWQLPKDKLPIKDETFNEFVENTILSIPLRLKISEITEKGKISQDDFKFLKKTILNGIFFDFIDLWHTILKRKFREDE